MMGGPDKVTDKISDKIREEGMQLLPDFDKRGGLLPCVVQDEVTGSILMLGYVNFEALDKTRRTGAATFFSTSRNELWTKGETSGNVLKVSEIRLDCDQDALLYRVTLAKGGACHTANDDGSSRYSCFYRKIDGEGLVPVAEGGMFPG